MSWLQGSLRRSRYHRLPREQGIVATHLWLRRRQASRSQHQVSCRSQREGVSIVIWLVLRGDPDPTGTEALGVGATLQHRDRTGPWLSHSKMKTQDVIRLESAGQTWGQPGPLQPVHVASQRVLGSSTDIQALVGLWSDCFLRPFSEPLSSVSSLEVHFDLLDLTELTDMSDQELAEVFADSDDENLTSDSPAGESGGAVGRYWVGPGSPRTLLF